jgi:uncharacterized repeat protein (TIGR04076 family)
MNHKVKVTVIDKKLFPELQKEYCSEPQSGPCPCYNVGDEFVFERDENSDHFWHGGLNTLVKTSGNPDKVAGGPKMPHCSEAWDAISRYIYAGLQGGSIMKGWMKDENVMIACCSDGTRPVIFKIERIDEEDAPKAQEPAPAAVPQPDPSSDRQKEIAAKLFNIKAKPAAPPAPAPSPAEPVKTSDKEPTPGLPELFESPEPWDPSTDGDFVPTLDFNRYWRLNYSLLSAEDRKAYEALEEGIRRGFPSIKVDLPPDTDRITAIVKALVNDNWSLFYIDTGATVVKDPEGVYVCFHYNRFKEDRENWMKAMKDVARNVFELRVKDCRTRYDAEMAIHDFITESVTYDKSDPEIAYNPLGPLLWHKGVCEGISEAFTFLANACGLKVAMTSGKLKGGSHRWNIIELDNKRYNLDVTSDLGGLHGCFNCSDAVLAKTHTGMPKLGCNSDDMNFYKLNGSMFKMAHEASKYIETQAAKGSGTMFEFMVEYGVNPSEVTRIAKKGAGNRGMTVTNQNSINYRITIK